MVLNIRDLLKDAKSVCLTGHIRPDGDSIGAALGLYTYLQINFPEIKADVYLEPPAGKMKFIVNFDKIKEVKKDTVCFGAGREIPVSRRYQGELRERHMNKIRRLHQECSKN